MIHETTTKFSPPPSPVGLRVGIVGLGSIGRGVATSLARSGRAAVVYDLRAEAADGFPGDPAPLGSPAEVAASSDVVIVAVVDAQQVTDVITGSEGLLAGAHPGLIIVITATISVGVIRDLERSCAEKGVGLLDCGVTGGSRAAENGLIALVGGPDDLVSRARPVIEDFAARVLHCGALGAGMATKLSSQIVTAGRWRAVHEAVKLAEACGVDAATLVDVVEASDPEGTALMGLQRLRMAGRTVDAFGRPVTHYFRNVDKDMAAAQELAAEKGVALPLVDLTRAESPDTFAWLANSDD